MKFIAKSKIVQTKLTVETYFYFCAQNMFSLDFHKISWNSCISSCTYVNGQNQNIWCKNHSFCIEPITTVLGYHSSYIAIIPQLQASQVLGHSADDI